MPSPRVRKSPLRSVAAHAACAAVAAAAATLCGPGAPSAALGSATELPKLLQRGRAVNDLAGDGHEDIVLRIIVPEGARNLVVRTAGTAGNCDLFLRRGAHPTTGEFDAMSARSGSSERAAIERPEAGIWYVLLHGAREYSGVSLTASYGLSRRAASVPILQPGPGIYAGTARVRVRSAGRGGIVRYTTDGSAPTPSSPRARGFLDLSATTTVTAATFLPGGRVSPAVSGEYFVTPADAVTVLASGVPSAHRCGVRSALSLFRIDVAATGRDLRVATSGGTGDTVLLLRRGAPPTAETYDIRADDLRNRALAVVPQAEPGEWYAGLFGVTAHAGVQVFANLATGTPDLIVWPESLAPYVVTEDFPETDCAVQEGIIVPGTRRLLRFTTETRNIGGADMVIGPPSADDPRFTYHDCHGHFHFRDYASYRLLDLGGGVVATGAKVSFCLEDVAPFALDAARTRRYSCSDQGIQSGWADVYDSGLDGQWVDITGVAPGDYDLEVTVNPAALLPESDATNNAARVRVTIPAPE